MGQCHTAGQPKQHKMEENKKEEKEEKHRQQITNYIDVDAKGIDPSAVTCYPL